MDVDEMISDKFSGRIKKLTFKHSFFPLFTITLNFGLTN